MEQNILLELENIVLYCEVNGDSEIYIQSGDNDSPSNDDDIRALRLQNDKYVEDEGFRDYEDDALRRFTGSGWVYYQPEQQRQLKSDNADDVTQSSIERI